MTNQSQTAKNSKTHKGDAPLQIISTGTKQLLLYWLKEARQQVKWSIRNHASAESIAYWEGRAAAFMACLDALDMEISE